MKKYSNEKIIEILKNLSRKLGKPNLSKKDIATVIPTSTVNSHFGSIRKALEAAGLESRPPGISDKTIYENMKISEDDLFRNLHDLETDLGKEPGFNDCASKGKYSTQPYKSRFGKWGDVLSHYRKWKIENNMGNITVSSQTPPSRTSGSVIPPLSPDIKKMKKPEQFYGEPIGFRGLRHAPINEQGVVFLFGMICRELGFNIEAIQQGFPDCEGKYLYDQKKNLWAKARIEFEYKASSFVAHGHSLDHCDYIVCWINDWKDCPINVIELKTEILKLPSL